MAKKVIEENSSMSVEDLWNSSPIAYACTQLEEGVYKATLDSVKFGKKIPLIWTFQFSLTGDPENGDLAGQNVEQSFYWHDKEGKIQAYMKVKVQQFVLKLLGTKYSHDFEKVKETLEELTNYPVEINITNTEFESRGKTVQGKNILVLPRTENED